MRFTITLGEGAPKAECHRESEEQKKTAGKQENRKQKLEK